MAAKKRKEAKILPGGHPVPMTAAAFEETRHLQVNIMRIKRDDPQITWCEIAELVGHSHPYVKKLYQTALDNIIQAPAEETLKMELERLDAMYSEAIKILKSFHPVVNAGRVIKDIVIDEDGNPIIQDGKLVMVRLSDSGPKLAAIDRALKIMERRAKYLGIDKDKGDPSKQGLTAEEFAQQVLGTFKVIDEVSGGVANG